MGYRIHGKHNKIITLINLINNLRRLYPRLLGKHITSEVFPFQIVPTPGKEFPEYYFVKQIRIEKPLKDDDKTSKEIAKWTTAFMNTSSGLIVLFCPRPDSDQQRDRWVMGLEHVLMNRWIPKSSFQNLVRFKYLEEGYQLRIYMFVCKSPQVITFRYNAYVRQATFIRQMEDARRVQQMLNGAHINHNSARCYSVVNKLLGKSQSFKLNDPIPAPYRENETMEFKHCYSDKSKKKELESFGAGELRQRLQGDGGYIEYISAFANSHGGSLVIGVEEGGKVPVVRGFKIAEDEKQKIHDCLKMEMEKCIWKGDPKYKPCYGNDWQILYHDVMGEKVTGKRQLIEICIPKHAGGMFLRPPIYYLVNKYGKLESNAAPHEQDKFEQKGDTIQHEMFEKWKKEFQTDFNATEEVHTQSSFRRHWNRPDGGNTYTSVQSGFSAGGSKNDVPVAAAVKEEEEGRHDETTKVPKSFRESESEHKTDIDTPSLNLTDCCSTKMAEHIKSFKDTKTWYPHWETMQEEFPEDARFAELINFIDADDWDGVATVICGDIDPDAKTDQAGLAVANCSLICHVLIARKGETPILICCIKETYFNERTQENLDKLVTFALCNARMLKRQYLLATVNKPYQSCIFHFDVEVLVVPTKGSIEKIWSSSWPDSQPVVYPHADSEVEYSVSCNGVAERLLKTRYSVRDRYGNVLTEHLTEAQARILLERNERVLIVSGKSGTGKTVIALHLVHSAQSRTCQRLREEDVLYICSNAGLEAFIRSQVLCRTMVVKKTDCLSSEQREILCRAKLVIVDDLHAIQLGKEWKDGWEKLDLENPTDLYSMLFRQAARGTNIAIFFDSDQDYEGHLPDNFHKWLRNLAERVDGILPQDIVIITLSERIRNSREINRFMQANQNQAQVPGMITCLNEEEGDDIRYEYIGGTIGESVSILNEKLCTLEKTYSPKSIAILCDDASHTLKMKTWLMQKYRRAFQEDGDYPVHNIVLCSLEDFGGLEADVVLFVLPPKLESEAIKASWKYINTICSRAKQRLEFLLSWEPREEKTKEGKIANLLDLFKMVSE